MGLRRFLKPSILLRRKALRSGVFGGQRGWLGIWLVMFVWKRIKSLFGFADPAPVLIEDVEPGQRFVIAHQPATGRRSRRKADKSKRKTEKAVTKANNKVDRKEAKATAKVAKKNARKEAKTTVKAAKVAAKTVTN